MLGTEQEDLKDIPGKLRSILLLLPKDEVYQEKLQEKNSDVGVGVGQGNTSQGQIYFQEPNMFFIKKHDGNVCGTIVLIHSVVTGYKRLVSKILILIFFHKKQATSPGRFSPQDIPGRCTKSVSL